MPDQDDIVSELPARQEPDGVNTFDRIARILQLARGREGEPAWGGGIMLVGAGASISAGVPAGSGVSRLCAIDLANRYGAGGGFDEGSADNALEWLKKAGHIPHQIEWANAYNYFFDLHYTDPILQRRIIQTALDKGQNRINWAHLCIGELIANHYLHTVLTTNFDQLVLEGSVYAGIFPAIADGLESLARIDPKPPHPQVVHLHGSRHAYRLFNSTADVKRTATIPSAQGAIYSLLQQAPFMIILGYGGGEEGVMTLLQNAVRHLGQKNIFWILYDQDPRTLPPQAADLMDIVGRDKVIPGQDADAFLIGIMKGLGRDVPEWIDQPLLHYKSALGKVFGYESLAVRPILDARKAEVASLEGHLEGLRLKVDVGEQQLEQARRAKLSGDLERAAGLFSTILAGNADLSAEVISEAAATEYELGLSGQTEALLRSTRLFRMVLDRLDSQAQQKEWATTQTKLAKALSKLGNETRSASNLWQATTAIHEAQKIISKDSSPIEWAALQEELGRVYGTLAHITLHTSHYTDAVTALQEALKIAETTNHQDIVASVQANLAEAKVEQASIEIGNQSLEEAIAGYKHALAVQTKEANPTTWAATQHRCAYALSRLGLLRRDENALKEAITILRTISEVRTPENGLRPWVSTQALLADTLTQLGAQQKDKDSIEEGINLLRAVLAVQSMLPKFNWSDTYLKLGRALRHLGSLTEDLDKLRGSIDENERALQLAPKDIRPRSWAVAKGEKGLSHLLLGTRTNDKEEIERAMKEFRGSLEVWDKSFPMYAQWSRRQLEVSQKALENLKQQGNV